MWKETVDIKGEEMQLLKVLWQVEKITANVRGNYWQVLQLQKLNRIFFSGDYSNLLSLKCKEFLVSRYLEILHLRESSKRRQGIWQTASVCRFRMKILAVKMWGWLYQEKSSSQGGWNNLPDSLHLQGLSMKTQLRLYCWSFLTIWVETFSVQLENAFKQRIIRPTIHVQVTSSQFVK